MSTELSNIKPNYKDIPIIDAYLRSVILCEKHPARQVAAASTGISVTQVYAIVNKNKQYISKKVKEYLKEADIDKLQVLSEIKNIAFSNISDYGKFANDEMSFEDWENLSRADLACIKDVKITYDKFGNKNVHFVLYDKQTALRDLTKILELSHDIVEHKGSVTFDKRLFDD